MSNQLWKKMNDFSNRIVIDTPEDIWKRACEYFSWCDDNPITWKTTVMSGNKAGNKVENESPQPYGIRAFCLYSGITESYMQSIRQSKSTESPYYIVISKILSIIYVQNMNYATTGVFNPVFTAKLLSIGGTEEDTRPSAKVEIITNGIPDLSSSEAEVLEKLEMEKSFKEIDKEQKIDKKKVL